MTNAISDTDLALAREHGLSADEYDRLLAIVGRRPTKTEIGIFGAMWSEHCSYKSSKNWLKKLPVEGPRVICGPGENAGVVDIGEGQALVFKMESHNHPSFIEPYQGAATGVGGIMRDVFTMGARPIANMNALRFGDPSHPKTRHLVAGVVAGIGDYGNCMGVPTVGGETNFHAAYNGNILVNAMTVGLADAGKIFYSAAAGVGNSVVYVGSKTGRDGIKGAVMASDVFSDDSQSQRPTVQVGDPFTEKLLLEACLELMATDSIVAIQDMGAAGLTSSAIEMAAKGRLGIQIDLDLVPQRETDMTAYDIMLSESQERMVIILKPGREGDAQAIFRKWELDFAVIGHLTDTGRLVLTRHGAVEADLPVLPLVDEAPRYNRPIEATPAQSEIDAVDHALPAPALDILKKLVGCPDLASRRWIAEQYDSLVRGDTVAGPGEADAAIVRLPDNRGAASNRAIAITTDCTPRYVFADPKMGGRQAVAEAWRNLTATGALPIAVTDNMNFGSPEVPRIMGQFALSIEGMAEACLALDFPVVSGNVSLYNATNGEPILPTPAIGAVGLIDDIACTTRIGFPAADMTILLIGKTKGHIGQSLYLREIHGIEAGSPPEVDLAAERANGDMVRGAIEAGVVTCCHDISDGGLLVALAEMAMASGIGATLDLQIEAGLLFGEDQGRYIVVTDKPEAVKHRAATAGVPIHTIGATGGEVLSLKGEHRMAVAELKTAHEDWLPAYMADENESGKITLWQWTSSRSKA
jgi:phosphoribosylformylglycinamidine synthase